MDIYLVSHSVLVIWCLYFITYSLIRISKHFKDGKNRVRTSGGRLITKIVLTMSCALLSFLHIADYFPGEYSKIQFIAHTVYFVIAGISWLFSAVLVYFSYTRTLDSEWKGQRLFWIISVPINVCLLTMNILIGIYDYSGRQLLEFDLIQITCYSLSILFSSILSFYSIFRPNDFSVISEYMHIKLKKSGLLFDDCGNESIENTITLTLQVIGIKIKNVLGTQLINYNINISVNDNKYSISRTLQDFQSLDLCLRKKFPKIDFPDLKFPEFNAEILKRVDIEERIEILNKYLKDLSCDQYMTSDLLNFLQIEGSVRDILSYKHNLIMEELLPGADSLNKGRADSKINIYYSPLVYNPPDIEKSPNLCLKWIIKITIPSHRYDEISQILDYYVRIEILKLGIDKSKPFKFTDFHSLHKTLKKSLSPGNLISFPSKNKGESFKKKDKNAIDSRKIKLEYYLNQIYNDPAYICRESLDFIECDAEVAHIYDLIPEINYKILDEMTWEGEISDDSSHYILYSFTIVKTHSKSNYEIQWKVSKRFREFDTLQKQLAQRQNSIALKNYLNHIGKGEKEIALPNLPSKTISPLSTLEDIEGRKKMLQGYLNELVHNPAVTCSFIFREFIEEKE